MTELIVIEQLDCSDINALFKRGGADALLDQIRDKVKDFVADTSTEKGRKDIASIAYQISRSKTYLDDLGKRAAEDSKKIVDAITSERKKIREALDNLKYEIRRPLTRWENAEAERTKKINDRLVFISSLGTGIDSVDKADKGLELVKEAITEDFQEFNEYAKGLIEKTLDSLMKAKNALFKEEETQAEMARLKKFEEEHKKQFQKEVDALAFQRVTPANTIEAQTAFLKSIADEPISNETANFVREQVNEWVEKRRNPLQECLNDLMLVLTLSLREFFPNRDGFDRDIFSSAINECSKAILGFIQNGKINHISYQPGINREAL